MFRFANYVFGNEVDSDANNENIDFNECIAQDIDDDWVLIDVAFDDKYKKQNNSNDRNGNDLHTNAANYETTTNRVPQTDTSDAQHYIGSHSGADIPDSPNPYQGMEESWFVTPPPCFNSLSNPIIIETTPLENLLIEHPSMSVFGPSLPPIDHQMSNSESSSTLSPIDMSSNDSTLVSTQIQSRRQMRQTRRQQQLNVQNRNGNQTNINLHMRTVVFDELQVLSAMQSREVSQWKKMLTKSNLERQNKVLVERNRPPNRRTKMALRPNGICNNRKNC